MEAGWRRVLLLDREEYSPCTYHSMKWYMIKYLWDYRRTVVRYNRRIKIFEVELAFYVVASHVVYYNIVR